MNASMDRGLSSLRGRLILLTSSARIWLGNLINAKGRIIDFVAHYSGAWRTSPFCL